MATSKAVGQQAPGAGSAREADLQLVERCRRGELGAFDELYKAHSGRLYSLACRMLGNPADAEDLLQEIFLSAHRKLDSFRGDAALGTWLYRLGMNQILDHVRSRAGRAGQITDGLDDATTIADASGHRLADRAIDRIDLEHALGELPPGCRAAFLLHDVDGLEHREVSEVLGIAEGTSKSQVHKARLRLRGLLRARR
ncbi:MAG TPA: RNA polymerase sigma factor [Vicinamibacterales bacterium]|jgi:RNA polymerase sigma-70 factor (ECF subfamily)|nr:RNA polymerase sigma factor [Vicinamibacterales bacterium]